MAICPECGSNTAETDIFCPYCGITLASSAAPEPAEAVEAQATPEAEDEDAFASTIMMPSELRAMPEQPAGKSASDDVSSDDDAQIPVPDLIAGHVNTASSLPKDTSEYEFEADSSAEELDAENAATASPASNDEAAGSLEMPETGVAPEQETSDDPPARSREGELERAREQTPADRGIARPSIELEIPQPDTTFDSVRIIETKPGQDDIDTRIQGMPSYSPPPPVPEPAPADDAPAPSDTAQNIGRPDTDGRKGPKLKPLTEGTVLNGRYEIVRRIGGGGMGAVYLASDNNLGGVLRAVKEMVQAHIEEEQQEKSINDFKRESMILSTLDHPAIPTIYDYFYDDSEGRFYLVMKYISGGDLSSRLRAAPSGKIDELSVTEWAIQIIDVLDYLHSQPSTIVYRDLKPSNIMIDGNSGRVMLIDFGIARSISQKEEKGVTAVGTMGYAPPELFSGNVEPRSDIYSLGSTMFHLLTGADPQSNPLLIFDFQKNPRPRQINSQLSDQIERIIMRAVEYNADARFSSAAEMRTVLEEHLAHLRSGKVSYGISEVPAAVSLSNQAVFCGFCGQRIVATDLFCAFCGSKQPIAQHGVHSEIYSSSRAATAKLIIEGTSDLQTPAFTLQKDENLLGRRDPMSNIFPEVDLSKYDPQTKISRRHARIWREGGQFMVEDLGSSNGTILATDVRDAFRLPPRQPHPLGNGDRLRLGDTTLHFMLGQ